MSENFSKLVFDTGKYCLNECSPCGLYKSYKAYGIGVNLLEENALLKVIKAFLDTGFVIGNINDPLSNVKALEIIVDNHKDNELVFNPSSFLTNESRRVASKISEVKLQEILEKDYSQLKVSTQEMINVVNKFGSISVSDGKYQAYSETLAEYGNKFLQKHIEGLKFHSKSKDRSFGMTPYSNKKFFEKISREKIILITGVNKTFSCTHENPDLVLYFKKEGEQVYLMQSFCCSINGNEYASINTGLSVDDLNKISAKKLRKKIVDNKEKFSETTLGYYLGSEDANQELDKVDQYFDNQFMRGVRFNKYLMLASELVSEKRGKHVDIYEGALINSDSKYNIACYMCSKVGKTLKENGINRQEWHKYLEANK